MEKWIVIACDLILLPALRKMLAFIEMQGISSGLIARSGYLGDTHAEGRIYRLYTEVHNIYSHHEFPIVSGVDLFLLAYTQRGVGLFLINYTLRDIFISFEENAEVRKKNGFRCNTSLHLSRGFLKNVPSSTAKNSLATSQFSSLYILFYYYFYG